MVAVLNKAEPTYLITLSKMQQVLWAGLTHVKSLKGVITAEELKGPAPEGVSQDPAQVTDDDLAFLQFTSGSHLEAQGRDGDARNLSANATRSCSTG
jgi:acyl-CoA synthetase (AMP-forming)/AMP-acid ligase II